MKIFLVVNPNAGPGAFKKQSIKYMQDFKIFAEGLEQ